MQVFRRDRVAVRSNEISPDKQIPSYLSIVNVLGSNPNPTYTYLSLKCIHWLNVQQGYKNQLSPAYLLSEKYNSTSIFRCRFNRLNVYYFKDKYQHYQQDNVPVV